MHGNGCAVWSPCMIMLPATSPLTLMLLTPPGYIESGRKCHPVVPFPMPSLLDTSILATTEIWGGSVPGLAEYSRGVPSSFTLALSTVRSGRTRPFPPPAKAVTDGVSAGNRGVARGREEHGQCDVLVVEHGLHSRAGGKRGTRVDALEQPSLFVLARGGQLCHCDGLPRVVLGVEENGRVLRRRHKAVGRFGGEVERPFYIGCDVALAGHRRHSVCEGMARALVHGEVLHCWCRARFPAERQRQQQRGDVQLPVDHGDG